MADSGHMYGGSPRWPLPMLLRTKLSHASSQVIDVIVAGGAVRAVARNGSVVSEGIAATDASSVINAALDSSPSVLVQLAPATRFTCRQPIVLRGTDVGVYAASTCVKSLRGGGQNSTVLDYVGEDPNAI